MPLLVRPQAAPHRPFRGHQVTSAPMRLLVFHQWLWGSYTAKPARYKEYEPNAPSQGDKPKIVWLGVRSRCVVVRLMLHGGTRYGSGSPRQRHDD